MTTALHFDNRYATHTLPNHPEHGGRMDAIYSRLQSKQLLDAVDVLLGNRLATREELKLVHTDTHLDLLAHTATLNQPAMLGFDTYVVPQSYEIARYAVGALLNAVDAVAQNEINNALVCVRPPGHHATPSRPMGFCLLSNIAIAARYAIQNHSFSRVAIVDFDVHHGNGTQDALYDNGEILFISSHESPLYPGSGQMKEIGIGSGRGTTINVPVPARTDDAGMFALYKEVVIPALERFQPDLLLISAGFDAHWRDPLANLYLSLQGFADIVQQLLSFADRCCGGKVISVTEGGYDLDVLSHAVCNLLSALLQQPASIQDPLGQRKSDQSVERLIAQLRSLHEL